MACRDSLSVVAQHDCTFCNFGRTAIRRSFLLVLEHQSLVGAYSVPLVACCIPFSQSIVSLVGISVSGNQCCLFQCGNRWCDYFIFLSNSAAGFWSVVLVVLFCTWGIYSAHKIHSVSLHIANPKIEKQLRLVQISDVHIGSRKPAFLKK